MRTMASTWSAGSGTGAESLVGVRGKDPLKLKAFRLFSYKKGQKFRM